MIVTYDGKGSRKADFAVSQWLDKAKPNVDYNLPADANNMNFVDRVALLRPDGSCPGNRFNRVITLGLADIGANYGGFKISRGYHQLTHHGKVPEYITELSVIEQFHMEQLARFLNRLKSVRDNHGNTLLDSTMVLFGSEWEMQVHTPTRIFH